LKVTTYLAIGHIALDVVGDTFVPGGTATYAAVTASRLGCSVRVFTSCDANGLFAVSKLVPGDIAPVGSPTTTTFNNMYVDGSRQQYLLARADMLHPTLLPTEWRSSDIIHLAPIAQEVDEEFAISLPDGAILGATPQGWMREWTDGGLVHQIPWVPQPSLLAHLSALVLSEADVGQRTDLIEYYSTHCPLVVVTRGPAGCSLFRGMERIDLPTRPADEIDPTGAGDVFAAAFFIRLHETGDPLAAARFANVTASMSVEGIGTSAIPCRAAVEHWLCRNGIS